MEQAAKRQKFTSLGEQAETAEFLVKSKSYENARKEAEASLGCLQRDARSAISSLPDLARIFVARGKAILYPLVHRLPNSSMASEQESVVRGTLEEARAAFELAWRIHPPNIEAKELDEWVSKKLSAVENFMELDDAGSSENGGDEDNHATQVGSGFKPEESLLEANMIDAAVNATIRPHVEVKDSARPLGHPNLEVKDSARPLGHPNANDRVLVETTSHDNAGVTTPQTVDVVIVGAGASGIGVAVSLVDHFGISREQVCILERGAKVGETFRRWPKEMRFISPSFNQQSWTKSFDLNSIAYGTSPASFLGEEHPTGEQYASYLEYVASETCLNIHFHTEVLKVSPVGSPRKPEFDVHLHEGCVETEAKHSKVLRCKYVVWAAGEFQYPKKHAAFPGSELCLHNSQVSSWEKLPGNDFVVVGGYESGLDATVHLARAGRNVTVVASTPCWEISTSDPSTELAPFTRDRLREVTKEGFPNPPKLYGGLRVTRVEQLGDQYLLHTEPNSQREQDHDMQDVTAHVIRTTSPPILGIGFEGSVAKLVANLFEWGDPTDEHADETQVKSADNCAAGSPLLTDEDESTKTEGLFLVGPAIRHKELVFCFIYKFRQRFGLVAESIARRLGVKSGKELRDAVKACRNMDMFLDNLAPIMDCSEEGCC
eukprot:gnl/MRDRNA2_/MRDRNA2_35912_c0_seq2.p1 gnl/MRDRNA2_/MRDRNA2_35912_c0~~gnl/MRDRNA2_/MRDRNA2_35912_c0_seq2.p1  ORF type:complete len:660 (+),score=110.09 gnl/MRDRNA2_/MRDRNA2_35912_c0_seq2:92-2071(+)